MSDKKHWEEIYQARQPQQVSWFQQHAAMSLQFIQETGVAKDAHILDVGGGASVLVDDLLKVGYRTLSVLDISAAALLAARNRMGSDAVKVNWLEADVTSLELSESSLDVWHDRAVFHFLTLQQDRQRYVQTLLHALKPGGHVIIATFAEDGPQKCSGLDVVRYRPETLQQELGNNFTFVKSAQELHRTPTGVDQHFVYCYFRR